jgi:hypothetical protein
MKAGGSCADPPSAGFGDISWEKTTTTTPTAVTELETLTASLQAALAGKTFLFRSAPIVINWTGGDPNTWVTFTLVDHYDVFDLGQYAQAPATAGTIQMGGTNVQIATAGPNTEIIVQVTPDPSSIILFSASGLSLGGRHSWAHTHRFEGVVPQ